MKSGSEDQSLVEQSKSNDDVPEFHKKSKISYTRIFLLSFSELDTCKRLPSGLDRSILGEICDSWTGLLQPCDSSDSGRFHGYLSRHSRQNPEHGVLGSGGFPRVSSCMPGFSALVVKDDDYYLLNRSNAAYQPPHRFKALMAKVHSSTESKDLYNNETFGSSDSPDQGIAEEERRRREYSDSFDLMRKEQHKTFQEKQRKKRDEHKENLDPEVATPLEASGNYNRHVHNHNESEECVASPCPSSYSTGHNFTTQTSAIGNLFSLVPESRTLTMNFGTESLTHALVSEPCDVKTDHTKSYGFYSSDFAHQFLGVWNEKVTKHNSTNLSSGRNEPVQNLMASTFTSDTNEISEQLYNHNIPNVTPGVLTSEDFELSILSELNEIHSTQHYPAEGRSIYDSKGFAKDSQTADFPGTQEDCVGMVTRNDVLKPHRYPIPAIGNNAIVPTANKSGSTEINREGIISKGCGKQTVVSKIEESLSISNDVQNNIGFNLGSEPESKLSPISGFHESADSIDEICLPEEDSLITVDDFIVPQDSTFAADGGSDEDDLFTLNSQLDIADKLEALNLSLSDEISAQLALDGHIFDSYDVVGMETSYPSLYTQQSLPQFGQYQANPEREFFKSSHAREVQMSFNTRSLDSEMYLHNPQPLHHFPTNVLADHSQHHPHAVLRKFGYPINSPLQKPMPMPSTSYSPHQFHDMPRGLPSPHSISELTCYTQELLRPTQHFPSYYKQQHYSGLEMPIADHIAGGISDKVALNRQFEMEVGSRQIHPPAVAGPSSGIFGKQVDMGLWYGQ